MSSFRSAIIAASFVALAPVALADDAAGLQLLIDMQDAAQVSKTFCVQDSKLYSVDGQTCVSATIKLTCALVDPQDASKGVKWVASDEKSRCRGQ